MVSVLDKKKNPSDAEIQKIPSYIFCRWLSGSPYTVLAANQINCYDKIPIENQYSMIKSVFAGKLEFIPYPKNVSEEVIKKIGYLSDFFKISEEKAKEYLEFISNEELDTIVEMYETYEIKKG
jgi:predicted SnoaL-like aldol condensation-catalyzing enzyme